MSVTIEMLPADYGDSLLVSWNGAQGTHRMLIDGGLVKSADGIKPHLKTIGAIDLVVMTHVDGDHIGGILELFRDPETNPLVRSIWFNAYAHLVTAADMLGPVQGEELTELLVSLKKVWNKRWPNPPSKSHGITGGPVMRNGLPPVIGLPGGATATLLSPTPVELAKLEPVWAEDVRKAGLVRDVEGVEEPAEEVRADMLGEAPTLAELAARKSGTDKTVANGSSIAFVFEHGNTRILFGGDAHPKVLLEGLDMLRHGDEPYRLDAFKLPHHASRKNVTNDLVAAVDCPNWLVSTNGVRFSHPNDEALARVIVGSRVPPHFVANYLSDRWSSFTERYQPDTHGYSVSFPPDGTDGNTISFTTSGHE